VNRDSQQRFLAKLNELDAQVNAGLRRQAERSLDVLQSMARDHKSLRVREQMRAIIDAQRPRVDSMPSKPNRAPTDRRSRSGLSAVAYPRSEGVGGEQLPRHRADHVAVPCARTPVSVLVLWGVKPRVRNAASLRRAPAAGPGKHRLPAQLELRHSAATVEQANRSLPDIGQRAR
jgi:hypothetical protein